MSKFLIEVSGRDRNKMKIQIMTKNMACAGTINWHKSSRIGANNRCWLRNIKRIPKASECQNEAEQISPLGRNEPSSLSQKNGQRHQYAIEHHRNMEANAPKMGLELLNSKAAMDVYVSA
jgi:hypothetical protein